MKAKDVISKRIMTADDRQYNVVSPDMSILDVLPLLLDSDERIVEVKEGEASHGFIDEGSLLDGFGKMLASRSDSSLVVLETAPEDFSASRIARAVEDADTHLVDMLSAPGSNGMIRVTLRVRSTDPTSVVNNLQRYDYNVVEVSGNAYSEAEVAFERLLSLRALLNV